MKHAVRTALFGIALSLTASAATAQDSTVFTKEVPADTEIQTTPSGLKYSVLRAGGAGAKPQMGDKVKVHYTGWTTEGRVFDSSRRNGKVAEFAVGQLISGWNEALQMMTPGARWKLTIPPDLAYGKDGSPPVIPPNATLVFDMELIAVTAMPRFTKPNPEAQTTTASGLKYEVVAPGSGEPITASQAAEIEFAVFNPAGTLVLCTEQGGEKLRGSAETMPLPFLVEAVPLMRAGSHLRVEVPAKLLGRTLHPRLLPATSDSVWELRATRVVDKLPVPEFSLPKDEELTTTRSGLKYKVIRKGGDGPSPRHGTTVTVHYAGWLTDGTLFDSSFGRGFETEFQVGRVIPGWNEGLGLMRPGAIYKFVIPGKLAYGARGSPPKIGPNATLVFHVELIKAD